MKQHRYSLKMSWVGNTGEGTHNYSAYRRDFLVEMPGKPAIEGSSDAAFRGDAARYSPEDMLVASLSSCHMLWYLHLCSVHGVVVTGYVDEARGVMEERKDGSGAFVRVDLAPEVTIRSGDSAKALALHEEAHRLCFIANSVNFPIGLAPRVVDGGREAGVQA